MTVAVAAAAATGVVAESFVKAADMSSLPDFDCDLTCNKYKTAPGAQPTDALQQLASFGLTHVRARIWNNPTGGDCNLTDVMYLARRVNAAGLKLWLDFHYSDTWADPGKQYKPAAWATYPIDNLEAAVYNYTTAVIAALAAQGTSPAIVQVGNEVTNGMLWPETGQDCSDSGALYASGCAGVSPDGNWPTFARLVAAGIKAVRQQAPAAVVMVHTDRGPLLSTPAGAQEIAAWFGNLTKFLTPYGQDWDAVGLSCYPHFGFGNTTNFAHIAQLTPLLPQGKAVYVAETAFPYSGDVPGAQFPTTPAGQLQYTQSALAEAQAGGASGLAWWGTEFTTPLPAGLSGMWDQSYTALPALTQGWQ